MLSHSSLYMPNLEPKRLDALADAGPAAGRTWASSSSPPLPTPDGITGNEHNPVYGPFGGTGDDIEPEPHPHVDSPLPNRSLTSSSDSSHSASFMPIDAAVDP